MALDVLANIPSGVDIFIDANVFIYGLGRQSTECVNLLNRCAREDITGITSYHVISEVTHRMMCTEATQGGHVTQKNARKQLAENPEIVKLLWKYWTFTNRLLSLSLLFLKVDEDILRGAQSVRQRIGLLNNDSILVSCMRSLGVAYLASNDLGFERVPGLTVFRPTDLNG